eukprot:471442-Hanusia_phi.AAC.1
MEGARRGFRRGEERRGEERREPWLLGQQQDPCQQQRTSSSTCSTSGHVAGSSRVLAGHRLSLSGVLAGVGVSERKER